LEGRGQRGQHQGQGRPVVAQREAKVAHQGSPEKARVLHGQGIGEAELCADALDLGRTSILRHVQKRGITREAEEEEERRVDGQHDDHQVEGALSEQTEHALLPPAIGLDHPMVALWRYMLHSGLMLTLASPLARALMLGCSYRGMCRASSHST